MRSVPRARAAIAAPQAIGRPAPMMAAVGISPTRWFDQVHRAAEPAGAADDAAADLADHADCGVTPSASAWPWPR